MQRIGSIENNRVTKRLQCATARIPIYLVVDVKGEARITMFTESVDGDYGRVTGGSNVEVTLADRAVSIADLIEG